MDKEPITVEGLEKLKLELGLLKNEKRPRIVAAIAEARSHGDLKENKNKTYKIVGRDEADISKNLIYFKSPIGKALIGKNIEDIVIVETPSGEKTFEVLEIQYI